MRARGAARIARCIAVRYTTFYAAGAAALNGYEGEAGLPRFLCPGGSVKIALKPIDGRRLLGVLADYLMITTGALLVAVAVRVFLVPNNVVAGGLTGVAQLLSSLIGTPVGLVVLALNAPLLLVGWRRLGGFVFGVRTAYAIVVMSLAIDLLAPFARPVTADPLLYSLYGGVIDGLGLGLILRARGTAGGTDIVARLVETRLGVQPGRTLLACDALIFSLAFFAYGPEKILYALLVAFVSSRAVDFVLNAGRGTRQALIITERPEGITRALLHDLGRGVTVLEGVGGYTGTARAVLLCIVSRPELAALKAAVGASDPHAFVIIGEVGEVLGEGFRPMATRRSNGGAGRPTGQAAVSDDGESASLGQAPTA